MYMTYAFIRYVFIKLCFGSCLSAGSLFNTDQGSRHCARWLRRHNTLKGLPRCIFLLLFGFVLSACNPPDFETAERTIATQLSKPSAQTHELSSSSPSSHTKSELSRPAIYFGDLHAHSQYSMDALQNSLPIYGGIRRGTVSDACDFARYCSRLDFWSINDHASMLTDARWEKTKQAVRACQAADQQPDAMVSFLGWEWTQIAKDSLSHFGHKNILLRDLDDHSIPVRPVNAGNDLGEKFDVELSAMRSLWASLVGLWRDSANAGEYWAFLKYFIAALNAPVCDFERPSASQSNCIDTTTKADVLAKRLAESEAEHIVIPHGNAWGLYTPRHSNWLNQLSGDNAMLDNQTLLEVYSGHGNNEEFRPWLASVKSSLGESCPAPTMVGDKQFVPCCWQAGEIVKQQCQAESRECEQDVLAAQNNYLAAGASGYLSLPSAKVEEWQACGQCPDCFLPDFKPRFGATAQAALAQRNFDEPDEQGQPRQFKFGFIASSDNHTASPGAGYKEFARHVMTDTYGKSEAYLKQYQKQAQDYKTFPVEAIVADSDSVYEQTRNSSFKYTGGLVAVHSDSKSREALWQALKERRVYGTSGPRIQLWFDLISDTDVQPMGSELTSQQNPRFRVRAIGDFEQRSGCPVSSINALGEQGVEELCLGECYNPGAKVKAIDRIEVVKVLPQQYASEPLAKLIFDPWKVIPCDSPEVCEVSFVDEEYAEQARNASYYVRAIQAEATPTINGDPLRCKWDDNGRCVELDPCYGNDRTPATDDCLAPVQHRAWSSPIFLNFR